MKTVTAVVVVVVLFVVVAVCCSGESPTVLENQNERIVRLAFYMFEQGEWTNFAELHSQDYVQHSPGEEYPIIYLDYEISCRIVHKELPDLKIRIVDIFAASDKVAVRSIWEYRNDSYQFKVYYPDGVAQGSEISIFRIEDEKIIEEWCEHDPAPIAEFCTIYKLLQLNK